MDRPGDWKCARCNSHNFATRDTCRNCSAGKYSNSMSHSNLHSNSHSNSHSHSHSHSHQSPHNQKPGDWNCPGCNNHNFAARDTCRNCGAGKNAQSSHSQHQKPGDWRCPCGEQNFASRTHCRKCQLVKGAAPPQTNLAGFSIVPGTASDLGAGGFSFSISTASGAGFGNASGTGFGHASGTGSGHAPATGSGHAPGLKPGDWHCSCGELNFATRSSCRKCGMAKPSHAPAMAIKPGDWYCSCGELNFARNRCCRKCKTVPNLGGPNWNCACGDMNSSSQMTCRTCGGARTTAGNSSGGHLPPAPMATRNASSIPPAPVVIQAAEVEEEEKQLCVVCMHGKSEVAIIVCGHLALCSDCAPKLKACPLCRVPYSPNQVIKIYHAGISE